MEYDTVYDITDSQDTSGEKIEQEENESGITIEYVGRIDSVIGEDEALLVTTMSPVDGLRCIAVAGDVIGKVDLSCLSEEELEAYGLRQSAFLRSKRVPERCRHTH